MTMITKQDLKDIARKMEIVEDLNNLAINLAAEFPAMLKKLDGRVLTKKARTAVENEFNAAVERNNATLRNFDINPDEHDFIIEFDLRREYKTEHYCYVALSDNSYAPAGEKELLYKVITVNAAGHCVFHWSDELLPHITKKMEWVKEYNKQINAMLENDTFQKTLVEMDRLKEKFNNLYETLPNVVKTCPDVSYFVDNRYMKGVYEWNFHTYYKHEPVYNCVKNISSTQ